MSSHDELLRHLGLPGDRGDQDAQFPTSVCLGCGAATRAACLPSCPNRLRGRLRWMPEVHCRCGVWAGLPDAECRGARAAGKIARANGWALSRKDGWMCPTCNSIPASLR